MPPLGDRERFVNCSQPTVSRRHHVSREETTPRWRAFERGGRRRSRKLRASAPCCGRRAKAQEAGGRTGGQEGADDARALAAPAASAS